MVDQDKIRMFITNLGFVIGEFLSEENGIVTLNHPLKLIPHGGDSMAVGALFLKEEWAKISSSNSIEISVPDGVKTLYSDYEIQIFSGIVTPNKQNASGLIL